MAVMRERPIKPSARKKIGNTKTFIHFDIKHEEKAGKKSRNGKRKPRKS